MTTTEAELGKLRGDIEKLRADLEKLGATIGRFAKAAVRDVGENAWDGTENIRAQWQRAASRVTDEIEDNPLGVALAAIGIGLLLGHVFSGRRR